MIKRVFLIVMDSVGIGGAPDAAAYGDSGSDTLSACRATGKLVVPNLKSLGLFCIDGVEPMPKTPDLRGSYARVVEASAGKDTTIGHWEIAGLVSEKPLPTYPEGFPPDVIEQFTKETGRAVLCNLPYSGTKVIYDYGREHMESGALIVYTSADSVFQIAAHENVVPVQTLYDYCETARSMLTGRHGVGRVIARPFAGEYPDFKRTSNRRDFSLTPPRPTMLDHLREAGLDTIAVGKINDIFAGRAISEQVHTSGNDDGMDKTLDYAKRDFHGLCFVNLVDFDMLYGHRNDVNGYAAALCRFDARLGELLAALGRDDALIITADHGCDPSTPSTDHSRECVPLLVCGEQIAKGVNLGTLTPFTHIARTVLDLLGVDAPVEGKLDNAIAPRIYTGDS